MKRTGRKSTAVDEPKPRTKQELVVTELRKAIVTGQLRGGERLHLSEVAAQFKVSHMPVREALWILHAEGLVTFNPHKGAVVKHLSAEEVQEVLEIRCFLEGMAGRHAVDNALPQDLEKLREILEQIELSIDSAAEYHRLNLEFHKTIIMLAKKERLTEIINNLRASTRHYTWAAVLIPEVRAKSQARHREILESFERKDKDKAERLMREHILDGARDMSDYFRGFNLP